MQQGGAGPEPGPYVPPQPGPYAPAPPGSYAAPPNEPQAVTALVLGILGIVACGVVAPFAWSIGKKSLANIRSNSGMYSGEGMANAGYILGIVGTILLIVAVIGLVIYLVFVLAFFAALS